MPVKAHCKPLGIHCCVVVGLSQQLTHPLPHVPKGRDNETLAVIWTLYLCMQFVNSYLRLLLVRFVGCSHDGDTVLLTDPIEVAHRPGHKHLGEESLPQAAEGGVSDRPTLLVR